MSCIPTNNLNLSYQSRLYPTFHVLIYFFFTSLLLRNLSKKYKLFTCPLHTKGFCRAFDSGTQEDAHELLLGILEAIQKVQFEHKKASLQKRGIKLPIEVEETSLSNRVFGGHTESSIECTQCNAISSRKEVFLDLQLTIRTQKTLEDALEQLFTSEKLEGENQYFCEKFLFVLLWHSLSMFPYTTYFS